MFCSLAGDKDDGKSPEFGSPISPEVSNKNVPEVGTHASQIICNMVNALSEESKTTGINFDADVKAVVEMAKAAIPELTPLQAEIVTTVLVEIAPNVTPEIVQETVEIAAGASPGICVVNCCSG